MTLKHRSSLSALGMLPVESEPLSIRASNLFFCTFLEWGRVKSCLVRIFFAIVDLNREDEATIEFFRSSVCFMWNGERFSMVFVELII